MAVVPVSVQAGEPELHDSLPTSQTLTGVQLVPAAHVTQLPLLHTMFAPQLEPLRPLVPRSLQTGVPVVQAICPLWQGLVGEHVAPDWQAPQTPLSQTRFVPQEPPLATLPPVSVQTGVPPEQSSVPVWQGLDGGQELPAVHVAHVPLSQTLPVPHAVPLAMSLPVSVQTEVPEAQDVAPTWQGLVGVHDAFAVQAEHAPLAHTMFAPQDAPFESVVPVSVHDGVDAEQSSVPAWQGLVGVHGEPFMHAAQAPVSQTSLVPQALPLGRALPVSTHAGRPLEQSICPTWQTFVGMQPVPAAHVMHEPE